MGDTRALEPSNFDGATLKEMQGWVEGGQPGADALHEKAEGWDHERKYLTELATRVKDRLTQARAVTESQSGDAMQNAMSPVVLWTEVTAENVQVQHEKVREQGDAFKRVKDSIPKKDEESPVPDDNIFEEGFDSIVNGKTDAEAANQKNEALRQEAVTAFNGYDSASQSNVAGSAVFTPPPPGGVETSVQGGPQQPVGPMQPASGGSGSAAGTESSWAGGGGAGGGAGSGGAGGGGVGTSPSGTNPSHYQPGPGSPGYQPGPGQGVPGQGAGGGLAVGGAAGGAGAGGAGRGAGGAGGAGRGGAGAGGGAGRGAAGGPGAGGRAGAGGLGGQSGSGPGGANAAGGRGGAGAPGGAGGAGRGNQQGDEDEEHETPEYLKGDHGFFDDEMPKVAPPVFGDWEQR